MDMKVARFGDGELIRVGVIEGDSARLAKSDVSVQDALRGDEVNWGELRQIADLRILSPFDYVPSFRDFYAFEGHVVNARAQRGLTGAPEEWFLAPAFYFSNPYAFLGHEDTLLWPTWKPSMDEPPVPTKELDFELEIGIVIGKAGRDIPVERAIEHVGGFTVLNDWSMRDVQRIEMKVGMGPHKAKDFATSIGPCVVTLDEMSSRRTDGPDGPRWDMPMVARVNGEQVSSGNFAEIHFTVSQLIAHASRNATIREGDLLGSGTVGTGCLLENPDHGYLRPGDHVELDIDGIGILANTIATLRPKI
jgi:fumarylacetoacetate (FAA) hydrolase